MYFSLRTQTEEQRKNAEKLVKKITKKFGKERVRVSDFDLWISIDIAKCRGWVSFADDNLNTKTVLHIVDIDNSDNVLVLPQEVLETVYLL